MKLRKIMRDQFEDPVGIVAAFAILDVILLFLILLILWVNLAQGYSLGWPWVILTIVLALLFLIGYPALTLFCAAHRDIPFCEKLLPFLIKRSFIKPKDASETYQPDADMNAASATDTFYLIRPYFWAPNILYKAIFARGNLYCAEVAGQFYDRPTAVGSMGPLAVPLVKSIERKRAEKERLYTAELPDDPAFLALSKHNRILHASDVTQARFRPSRVCIWTPQPILGNIVMRLEDGSRFPLVVLSGQSLQVLRAALRSFLGDKFEDEP